MKRLILIVAVLILLGFIPLLATEDYYVKNGGDDEALGTSDETAWETIQKVNDSSFNAGDNIYFKRGSAWYANCLEIWDGGSDGNPITYGAYDSGEKPIISGFTTTSTWDLDTADVGTNEVDVYSEDFGFPCYSILEGSTFLTYLVWDTNVATTFATAEQGSWSRNGNVNYVACTDNADPDTHTMYTAASNNWPDYSCMWVQDSSYVTIENIELRGGNNTGIRIKNSAGNAISDIIVDNVTARYNGTTGIQISNDTGGDTHKVTDCTVQNCTVSYNAYHGIALNSRVEDILVTTNVSHHNGWDKEDGIDQFGAHGISMYGDAEATAPHQCIIEYNEVYEIYEETDGGEGTGIQFDDNTNYCTVRFNKIYDCAGAGILWNSPNNTAYYNTIDTCMTGEGTYGAGLYFLNGTGNSGYNNIVYNCKNGITFSVEEGETVTVKNNIVMESDVYDYRWIWEAGAYGTVTSDNNCIYNSVVALNFLDWHGGAEDEQDLAEWQTDTGQDANSTEAIPRVIDAAGGDFRLLMASPCIDKGTDVGLTEDYLGIKIRHAPDIGAYENQCNAIFLPINIEEMEVSFIGLRQ